MSPLLKLQFYGAQFALPGMGEKGYLDLQISVLTPGGHSSVPPEHTGIGIMSDVVAAIEAHPFEPTVSRANVCDIAPH